MAHFQFAVSGQVLDLLSPTRGISDTLNANSVEFEFRSSEWEGTQKWAHFSNPDYNKGESQDYELIGDEISADRGLNLTPGIWDVFITGYLILNGEVIRRYVTESQSIMIVHSGIEDNSPLGQVDASVAEQVYAKAADAYADRITSATVEVGDGYGTPEASVSISGEPGTRSLDFSFDNLRPNDMASVEFDETEENYGNITVTMRDGTVEEFDGFHNVLVTLEQTNSDASEAEAARVLAEEGRVDAESARAIEFASWGDMQYRAEAYAVGTWDDDPLPDTDPAYNNNAKYYAESAADSIATISNYTSLAEAAASAASGSADSAAASEARIAVNTLDAEAWAVGTRNGVDVSSGDDAYHNNAKYYAESISGDTAEAAASALTSEGYAVGKQNGTNVDATSPYYHNNSDYYRLLAEGYTNGQQNGVDVASTSPYYHNNAKYFATNAGNAASNAATSATNAATSANNASGYANNASSSATSASSSKTAAQTAASNASAYANNASSYATAANNSKTAAASSASTASNAATSATSSKNAAASSASTASSEALKSEGYAVGKQNGSTVSSGTYYHNNAKYYSEQANTSKTNAATSATSASSSATNASNNALKAEGYAVGTQNGSASSGTYYQNNAKYYSDRAASMVKAPVYYGVCSTSGSTQTKAVAISGVTSYISGLNVRVKFANAQTYSGSINLNVSSLGTKEVRREAGTISNLSGAWKDGDVVDFVYDGTYFIIVNGAVASTSNYGVTKLTSSLESTSEVMALTASAGKALKDSIDTITPTRSSVTLAAASWVNNAITATVTGVLADETAQLIDIVPASASKDNYINAGVWADSQAANSITFKCVNVPTADLTVYATVTGVVASA